MASPSHVLAVLPEEQLRCLLCRNVYSDPITTPCGHTFCRACVTDQWDGSDLCQCPTCNKRFSARPEVSTNQVIEEMALQVKRRRLDAELLCARPWEVSCDVCAADAKLRAAKSCLSCLASFCEAHLEPHRRAPSLGRHKLIEPVGDLEDRVCRKHERPLESFCRHERVCVCVLCVETDHRGHDTVSIDEEGALQKETIESKRQSIGEMIKERLEKIEEIKQSSEICKVTTDKWMEDGGELFDTLMAHVKETRERFTLSVKEKQRSSEERAGAAVRELQQEVAGLQRTDEELKELSHTDDHLQLLRTFQALSTQLPAKDWSRIQVYSDPCMETARRAVSRLVKAIRVEQRTLTILELKRMREFKENVTLDPNTASRWLTVLDFQRRIKHTKTPHIVSDVPERFDTYPMVLGVRGFHSGRHYWEVQVGVRNNWDVGVAKETVTRKGTFTVERENGFYAIGKSGYDYEIHCTPPKTLYLNPRPRKIGVYLDYEVGRVSFYDVDQQYHIYSFTGESFKEKLLPYFYLHSNFKKSDSLSLSSMEESYSWFCSLSSQTK